MCEDVENVSRASINDRKSVDLHPTEALNGVEEATLGRDKLQRFCVFAQFFYKREKQGLKLVQTFVRN